MDIKKIYISGKITGLPVQEAIAKFRSAAEKIRRFGFEPGQPVRQRPSTGGRLGGAHRQRYLVAASM